MFPSCQQMAFALDFDRTITIEDTINTIVEYALTKQLSRGHDIFTTWSDIVRRYNEEYSDHVKRCHSALETATSIDDIIAYSRSFKELELSSFESVSSSGIFQSITVSDWEASGQYAARNGKVSVRSGFQEFVEKLEPPGARWGVVSVNFVAAFVRGVLKESARIRDVRVLANQPDQNGIMSGPNDSKVIATSDAKLIWMKDFFTEVDPRGARMNFYVGDSLTDIECVMDFSVTGIILSEHGDSELISTLTKVGVDLVHISEYPIKSKPTYWARNFREISSAVLLDEEHS